MTRRLFNFFGLSSPSSPGLRAHTAAQGKDAGSEGCSARERLRTQRCAAVCVGLSLLFVCLNAPSAQASFGLEQFDLSFTNEDGSPATQAGSHPFAVTTGFRLNTVVDPKYVSAGNTSGEVTDEQLKTLTVKLPAGFVGSPAATPRCATPDFLTTDIFGYTACPNSTAVGVTTATVIGPQNERPAPVYNLVPPPGVAVKLGFFVVQVPVTIEIGVNQESPYNVVAGLVNVAQGVEVYGGSLTVWGVPADPAHDPIRGRCLDISKLGVDGQFQSVGDCPTNATQLPFITLPRSCQGPLETSYEAVSWQNPFAVPVKGSVFSHDDAEPPNPQGMSGCSRLGFGPSITAQPTSLAAESPTGLDFGLDVHDEGLTSPTGLAQSDIKKAVVTLPEGMTANPSLAEGLNVCSEEDLARETVTSAPGAGCPSESKIGSVEVESPLIEEPLKGSLYIAKPHANPFDSLLALYFVIKNPTLGIVIKQAAKVEPNPVTGQLVTVVDNIPQLPFSHFKLHFREGARSPIVTPPACGSYNVSAELTPWSGGAPVTTSSLFQIISGPGAGACPAGGVPPFAPQITAGMLNNNAGSFSPFYLRLTRSDGEAEISSFSTSMPPGLSGILSGIPFCPEAAIEAARTKTGAQEQNEPSCPASSQLGHSMVGTGVGSALAYTPGRIYLAGPFHGDPFSLVSVTSAVVGPFDLGTVVIRFGLRIDPSTAQVNVDPSGSEPIPTIIQGIVTHVRDIRVYIDRPNFTLNPTSCDPKAISSTLTSNHAQSSTTSSRFQAANCAALKFTPKFTVSTSGKTSKANGASLTTKVEEPAGALGTQANIAKVKVELPKQLPSRLTTLQQACLAKVFDANPASCPAASVIGHATVHTPLLPVPLTGPAIFVSHGGESFPSLVMVLQGYGVTIDLVGTTFIDKRGITSTTFKTVPDTPFNTFELTLPQGKFSALATNLPAKANGSLCAQKLVMPTEFVGQNGAVIHRSTPISVSGCPKVRALSRKQKLAKALKACRRKAKGKRAGCVGAAHRRYGAVGKRGKKR
jgi:hypothetical protein